jgi:hypothetical protein
MNPCTCRVKIRHQPGCPMTGDPERVHVESPDTIAVRAICEERERCIEIAERALGVAESSIQWLKRRRHDRDPFTEGRLSAAAWILERIMEGRTR